MITLRILTRKSRLGVGAYAKETVGRMLELKKMRELRRIYYTYENITYEQDILMEIRITHPIPKPGSAPHLAKKNNDIMDGRRADYLTAKFIEKGDDAELARYKSSAIVKHKKKVAANKLGQQEDLVRMSKAQGDRLTKGRLQEVNHGHVDIASYMAPAIPTADTVHVVLRKTTRGNVLAVLTESLRDGIYLCFFAGTRITRRWQTRDWLAGRTKPVLSAEGQAALAEVRKAGYEKIAVTQKF